MSNIYKYYKYKPFLVLTICSLYMDLYDMLIFFRFRFFFFSLTDVLTIFKYLYSAVFVMKKFENRTDFKLFSLQIDGHDSGTESDGDLDPEDELHEMELSKYR